MSIWTTLLLFLAGFVIIAKGGDWFVDAAVWIANRTGVPRPIIGATVVTFATSLPELMVSGTATLRGSTDIALGNAIGSVICNLGLVLGVLVFFSPKQMPSNAYRSKSVFLLGASLLTLFLGRNGHLSSGEGLLMLAGFTLFIVYNVRQALSSSQNGEDVLPMPNQPVPSQILRFLGGATFILAGAQLLVVNGETLARHFGVPEQIISLTLIALGTSLPELVTAVSSILKKEYGLSVGNVLGANVFNLLMVLGLSSVLSPVGLPFSLQTFRWAGTVRLVPQTLVFDLPAALVLILISCVPFLLHRNLNRIHGLLLLAGYATYLGTLLFLFL